MRLKLVQLSLVGLGLFFVQIKQSLVSENLELIVGVLELLLHELLVFVLLSLNLKLLLALVPLGGSSDGLHSKIKNISTQF